MICYSDRFSETNFKLATEQWWWVGSNRAPRLKEERRGAGHIGKNEWALH
jgi:hypothetical protein